ncbi:hypothetical protein AB1E18_012103 [Capra hircus]
MSTCAGCLVHPCTGARREFARAGAAPPLQGGDRKRAWEQAPPHPSPGAPPRPTLGHRPPHPPHEGAPLKECRAARGVLLRVALRAGVSAISAPPPLSPPPFPPSPTLRLAPPRLRLEAPLSFLRRRSRRCPCLGVGAREAGPRGTQQAKILSMMEDNKQLALRIDGAVQSASQEVTNLRAELTATNRRLAELSGGGGPGPGPGAAASASAAADSAAANMENHQHSAQGSTLETCGFGTSCFNRLGPARIRSDIVDPVQVE